MITTIWAISACVSPNTNAPCDTTESGACDSASPSPDDSAELSDCDGDSGPWPCVVPTSVAAEQEWYGAFPVVDGGNCAPSVWGAYSDAGLSAVSEILQPILGDGPRITDVEIDWNQASALVAATGCGGGKQVGFALGRLIATGPYTVVLEARASDYAFSDSGTYSSWTVLTTERRSLSLAGVSMTVGDQDSP